MQMALAHWPPQELHELATLFQRMVGDLLTHAAEDDDARA